MHIKNARRWIRGACFCVPLAIPIGCDFEGEKVVTLPVVTEESLSPEQKAILDARRKHEAGMMSRVGVPAQMTPEEFARHRMEQVQAQQAAGGTAGANGGQP